MAFKSVRIYTFFRRNPYGKGFLRKLEGIPTEMGVGETYQNSPKESDDSHIYSRIYTFESL